VNQAVAPERWAARPVWAALIRAFAFVVPIAASIVFVNVASRLVPMPTSSFWLFLTWWILLSAAATGVLLLVDQLARRLLPLAALFKLSLVFPDRAPSRFETAMGTGTVATLEQRIAEAKEQGQTATPVEAAQRLLGLVATLDQHDKLTRGHCERVRAYAQMIAQEMRLGEADRDLLNWAALLHDVGKLGIPTEILTKPGKPTDEEWELLKRHPEFGEELIAPLRDWLGEWSRAVGEHHERWDGRGYPRGKAGQTIGLAGRIVAVADVFDVITSARSYKTAFSTAQARSELAAHAGTQFDERVVRAFLNVGLGRLRLIMGPLSWLAHAPILARMPLTPAVGALTGTVAAVAAAATTGLVHGPAAPPERPPLETVSAHIDGNAPTTWSHPDRNALPSPRADGMHSADPTQPAASALPVAPEVEWRLEEDSRAIVELRGLTDPENVARIRIIEPPQYGAATVTDDDGIAYTPPRDYNGSTWLGYEACWLDTRCAAGFVALTVVPINDLPATRPDVAQTDEDEPVWIDVLANDFDIEGSALDVVASWAASAGSTAIGDRRVAWRPPQDFNGRATFLYAAADADGGTAVDRVTVDVAPVNDAPVVRADEASTDEDVPVKIDLLENDSDPDGDKLEVLAIDPPTNGRVTQDGTSATYVPPPDFAGSARFAYTVTDRQGAAPSGTVDVTVAPVNDAPRPGADVASVDTGTSVEVAVLANDVDPEGDALSVVSVGEPTSGSVALDGDRVRFSAASPGTASFEYVVRDANGATARATVTVRVFGVNSAPSFVAGPDQNVGEDGGPQSVARWATAISAGRPDEAAQTVSFLVSTNNPGLFASGGRPAVASDGTLTYTPAPDANGTAIVTVRAQDNGGTAVGGVDTSAPQSRTISVAAVNDAPSAVTGANQSVLEDAGPQSVGGWATGISPGPPDESGQTVSFLATTPSSALFSSGGQPAVAGNGTLTYTPAANAFGVATVTVRAQDSGGTGGGGVDTGSPQTFTITIAGVNDAPDAVADAPSVDEDDADGVTFSVLVNDTDPDADALSVTAFDASPVTDGTVTNNGGGQFTFVPDAGFNGSQAFTYTVSDSHGGTDTAAVTITVVAQPDAPTAADDAYATTQGSALVQPAPGVLTNDGDEDGDPLTVQTAPLVAPANGTLALSANGSFTYTPAPGFVGTDTFTYRLNDGTGRTDDAVVTITVAAVTNTTTLFYLGTSGPSADVWDLITAPPPAASPVPDFDGDGSPGVSIFRSNGAESVSDSERWQAWTRTVSLQPLVLNGPVVLRLWSTVEDFDPDDAAHPHVFLYDCLGGGVSCVKIAANHLQVSNWNGGVSSWVYHEITVGSVSRTIPIGHELRIRLQTSQNDLWVAMTAAYPSALALVTGS
jgi:HD-GYP domain-containing protein (c-di-GMP phosphodiesterase class II)